MRSSFCCLNWIITVIDATAQTSHQKCQGHEHALI